MGRGTTKHEFHASHLLPGMAFFLKTSGMRLRVCHTEVRVCKVTMMHFDHPHVDFCRMLSVSRWRPFVKVWMEVSVGKRANGVREP